MAATPQATCHSIRNRIQYGIQPDVHRGSDIEPEETALATARAAAVRALPDVLHDAEALAAIGAPTGEEIQRSAWVEDRLVGLPGRRSRDEVGNLLWTFGEEAPDVLILAHLDSVFSRDVELSIRHSNGWLEGPGIGDNACAVSVCMSVIEGLVADHGPLSLAVAFTVGEEGLGNLRGARAALKELAPRRVVAVEGHGLGDVVVDAVGSVRAQIRIEGPSGHSWWDRGHPSAIHAMVEFLHALLSEHPGVHVNVGVIEGGSGVNAIAGRCVALVEARSVDCTALDLFEGRLGATNVEPPLHRSIEVVGRRPAGRLDPQGQLIAVVRRARRLLTLPDELGEGSTDANAALAHGIPAVGLGCAVGSGMHTVNERIDTSSVELGHAQLRLVLELALGLPQALPAP